MSKIKFLCELIKDVMFTLTHPSYWIMLNSYEESYDRYLNKIIENKVPIIRGEYVSRVMASPSFTIWTSNFPYGYGNPYEPIESKDRPSRRTIKKLKKYISETNYV